MPKVDKFSTALSIHAIDSLLDYVESCVAALTHDHPMSTDASRRLQSAAAHVPS